MRHPPENLWIGVLLHLVLVCLLRVEAEAFARLGTTSTTYNKQPIRSSFTFQGSNQRMPCKNSDKAELLRDPTRESTTELALPVLFKDSNRVWIISTVLINSVAGLHIFFRTFYGLRRDL
jgi:hypothetical protein